MHDWYVVVGASLYRTSLNVFFSSVKVIMSNVYRKLNYCSLWHKIDKVLLIRVQIVMSCSP